MDSPLDLHDILKPFHHENDIKIPCTFLRIATLYRFPAQTAPPGTLTAHEKSCLVLLHSCPDTVHRHPLRETQTSSLLTQGFCTDLNPPVGITPAIADCRYRAPLTPRLHGLLSVYIVGLFVKWLVFLEANFHDLGSPRRSGVQLMSCINSDHHRPARSRCLK